MSTQPRLLHTTVPVLGVPFHLFLTPEDGLLRASGFATQTDPDGETLFARLRERDPLVGQRTRCSVDAVTSSEFAAAVDALARYNRGDLRAINVLRAEQQETPFRGQVWRRLREIPPGKPVTYSELAYLTGRAAAVRAAASACANNLVALVVPCHRVVRADGSAGGYLFGTELKGRLLAHEAEHSSRLKKLGHSSTRTAQGSAGTV